MDGLDTRDANAVWEVRARVGLVIQNPDNQIVGASGRGRCRVRSGEPRSAAGRDRAPAVGEALSGHRPAGLDAPSRPIAVRGPEAAPGDGGGSRHAAGLRRLRRGDLDARRGGPGGRPSNRGAPCPGIGHGRSPSSRTGRPKRSAPIGWWVWTPAKMVFDGEPAALLGDEAVVRRLGLEAPHRAPSRPSFGLVASTSRPAWRRPRRSWRRCGSDPDGRRSRLWRRNPWASRALEGVGLELERGGLTVVLDRQVPGSRR